MIGLALVLGVFVRLASKFGILLMILYYLPILNFPYAGKNALIVDEHIIYIAAFMVLKKFDAGAYFGLENKLKKYLPKPLSVYI